MRKLITVAALLLSTATYAQETALWLRNPAISPDGKSIAFGYKGDIYKVDVQGGIATPLTIHEAHDMMPVWSHDGKWIAFASDRYGNFDVFVMPAAGGSPVRLTANSAADYPYDFTADNKQVLFGSVRNAPANSIRFPYRAFKNMYTVPITGGKSILLSAAGADRAKFNKSGDKLLFQDMKALEDPMRKHHVSSVTRDIWILDLGKNTYTQISDYEGEDLSPVWGNDKEVYYLSERNGKSINLFKSSTSTPVKVEQLTNFDTHPVRDLSRADNNLLCFTYNGEIYTLKPGEQPRKLTVTIGNDERAVNSSNLPVNGNITSFAISPNGKEMAFVARGEVFVASVDGNMTKRITNTPQQERMVSWSPDGKNLIYAAERNGSWDIMQTSKVRAEEPYFFNATLLKEEPVIATDAEEFQPLYSPDGKEIAYLENRNILKVYNIASRKTRTIIPAGRNYSYSDGDMNFSWSPDSKWLVADDQKGFMIIRNAAIIAADGLSAPIYPMNGAFGEDNMQWSSDGKMLLFLSVRDGRRPLAIQGLAESDIYAVFLDKAAYDRFKLSKDEFNLLAGTEAAKDKPAKDADSVKPKAPFQPDFGHLDLRRIKLTVNSASISDFAANKDASKVYYMAAFENGYDLWVTEPRTGDTKILAKLGGTPGSIAISKDGNTLFVSNRGGVVKVDANSGKITPVNIGSDMVLQSAKEREYIFQHAWKQVTAKFYDPTIRGLDWKMYRDNYARFLPHISNNYDFAELLSELLGELNCSHTGGYYKPIYNNPDITASLGLLYDETNKTEGLQVTAIMDGGPFDNATSKLKTGDIIDKIDGINVSNRQDWAALLNRKTNQNVLVSFHNAGNKTAMEEVVKPVSPGAERELMYNRWLNRMRQLVDSLSKGRVAYVHVRAMDDASYRTVVEEAMGRYRDRDALIVDTRFNGGGWLHDDLHTFLSARKYLEFAPQGNKVKGGEPMMRWHGISCVVANEGNYSDAYTFPYVYKQDKLGKVIGMPIPGTGTSVWWETQIDPTLVFGIPMVGNIGHEGRPNENIQLEPDIKVPLRYEDFLNGHDTQIEAAVKEMLAELKQ